MSFPLAGNKRIKESLEALIETKRLPHAVIIEGDEGFGKRTLARYLAKIAVCGEEKPPCNSCRNCHLADVGTHPDIELVAPEEKKKNIAVEQIRALRTTAYRSAHTAKRRAFIIEKADTMNASSQNSLLKVLEEPPSDVLFVLIATSAKSLLDTVVSRCLTLSLSAPTTKEGVEVLTGKFGFSKEEAITLLEEEKNNIGKAIARKNCDNESIGKIAACKFLDAIEKGSALSALLSTAPLEKDRPEASRFVQELEELMIKKIKELGKYPQRAKEYSKMYSYVQEIVPTLDTNINLNLFFASLTSGMRAAKNK